MCTPWFTDQVFETNGEEVTAERAIPEFLLPEPVRDAFDYWDQSELTSITLTLSSGRSTRYMRRC